MAKRKPMSTTTDARGLKKRLKKTRPVKQGAKSRDENAKVFDFDSGVAAEVTVANSAGNLATDSRTVETVKHEQNSNGNFQGIEHSDEDDTEDAMDYTINNENDCSDETEPSCAFHRHVSHIITNDEVSALRKRNCKFKWEIPALGIPKSKWVGTGEKIQGAYDDHLHDVKGKLSEHWQNALSDDLSSRMSFFSLCNSYRDIMYCNKKPFYLQGKSLDSSTMDAYLMHALNHVHRTRDAVIRNDAKLRNDANTEIVDDNSYLDQGFTRPKVLFLLPLKSFARRMVKRLIQLSPLSQKDSAMGLFKKQFGESDDEMEKPEHSTKPADFDLFAGDIEDHFLFGIKFTKKSVKLYSNFYAFDVIVASPLALKRKIDGEDGKEKDFDFLSSIEIVVVDHADVILMQNWAYLETVFEQLNHLPSKEHGTNVMRIRPWYLDQHAQHYRQTILLSSYLTPEMNALFNGLCSNYEGKVKMVTEYGGVLPKIQVEV